MKTAELQVSVRLMCSPSELTCTQTVTYRLTDAFFGPFHLKLLYFYEALAWPSVLSWKVDRV